MGNLVSTFEIEAQLRPCLVDDREARVMGPALWHCWTHEARPVPPSIMRGGHSGGQIAGTMALVELMDGSVCKVYPECVKFLGSAEKFKEYDWSGLKE